MKIKFADKEIELYEMVDDDEGLTWRALNDYGLSKLYLEVFNYSQQTENKIKKIIRVRNINMEQIVMFANMNKMSFEEAVEIAYEGYEKTSESIEDERRIVPINLAKATLIENSNYLKENGKGVVITETNYEDMPNKSGYELTATGEDWGEVLHSLCTVIGRHYDSEPQEIQLMLWVQPFNTTDGEIQATAKINDEEDIAAFSIAAIGFAMSDEHRDEFHKFVYDYSEEDEDND